MSHANTRRATAHAVTGLITSMAALAPVASAATFTPLSGMSQGSAVSADGRVVVGIATSGGSALWRRGGGVESIPGAPGTLGGGSANNVSADGTWVVGSVRVPGGSSFGLAAYRWSKETGMQVLPDQPGGTTTPSYAAQSVSADGSVVAGYGDVGSALRAFAWRASSGSTQTLAQLAGANPYSTVQRGISDDGSVIVGGAVFGSQFVATRTIGSTVVRMPGLNPGSSSAPFQDYAVDVSGDGRFAAGWSVEGALVPANFRAVLWDGLVPRSLGNATARAYGVSDDGRVVVGSLGAADQSAMIWTEALGLRDLRSYLASDLGLAPALNGWTLTRAASISADGTTLTGWGQRFGQTTGFIVTIPEPTALTLLLLPGLRIRRRTGHDPKVEPSPARP